ncbi:hypothetical protein [Gilvibacter sediminis]|uniref:hypothetical protein n=1 Tax=Gilvibacter sediminis TaxID=379071 RepID=UPI00234FF827|nr:hypothetical protein [Gilvibacter sediminis]MDC7999031.1 hypothetical protein [Gilvibacter sediminis]
MNLENAHNNSNPYGIPEGYFEGFEASVQARIAEEELRELVSDSGFVAPEAYFETVEPKVSAQLNRSAPKVISIFSRRTLYAVASVAAAVLLIVSLVNNGGGSATDTLAFDTIDTDTLEAYVNSDAIAFTDDELMDFVSEADLESSLFSDESLTDETIETYLLDNLDDIDLITTYEE